MIQVISEHHLLTCVVLQDLSSPLITSQQTYLLCTCVCVMNVMCLTLAQEREGLQDALPEGSGRVLNAGA